MNFWLKSQPENRTLEMKLNLVHTHEHGVSFHPSYTPTHTYTHTQTHKYERNNLTIFIFWVNSNPFLPGKADSPIKPSGTFQFLWNFNYIYILKKHPASSLYASLQLKSHISLDWKLSRGTFCSAKWRCGSFFCI